VADERRSIEDAGETSQPQADRLALELAELARMAPDRLRERIAGLSIREQATLALRVPIEQRLQLILHSPRPMRLVRALPDGDLYLSVREIGPTEAMPLLKLASAPQIQHLFDLESWRVDRFDADRSGAWMALLLEAGEPALRRFLRTTDDELLALLFRKWLRVEQLDFEETGQADIHGHGLSEAGTESGFVTPDGNYQFMPTIAEHAPAVRRILQVFFVHEPERYQRTLWNACWELPSELEEQALHWRQSRLEEHGFPPWEEAIDVYAPASGSREHPEPARPAETDGLAASRLALSVARGSNADARLAPVIDALPAAERERALHEMASLANRLLVADQADGGDPDSHRAALTKAVSFISVALQLRGATAPDRAGATLTRVPLLELFREGYQRVGRLQARARELLRSGWVSRQPAALDMLDSPIVDRVRALLAPRPGYVEVGTDQQVGAQRDFRGLDEIQQTAASLELAEVIGTVLIDRLGLQVAAAEQAGRAQSGETPSFSALFLTLLAWQSTRGELRGEPLPADVAAGFLRNVASRRTAPAEAPERALELMLRELAERSEFGVREIAVLQAFGRFALERLHEQCGGLDPGVPIDPRFVTCLLVEDRTGA